MSDEGKESIAEVLVHLHYIRASQERTETHLATLNGRTGKLERRVDVLDERTPANPRRDGSVAGALGGFVGGLLSSLGMGLFK